MSAPEIIVDSFAGGGGASTGIEQALGRSPDIAINHDRVALAMHEANHPQTKHYPEDVFAIDPLVVTAGRQVGLAWFSPDCTHFSKARGTKPRSKKIRGLAWVILRWAALVRPRVIVMENVEEFLTWGPLANDGQPCPLNKGRTFRTFKDALTVGIDAGNPDIPEIIEVLGAGFPIDRLVNGLGYQFEHRELRACDYGAPTIRKRLFGIARCDGVPIVWPAPTHGDPRREGYRESHLKPWRTAAECIDWSIACPSIFERKRPLADATCRRIAKGLMRHLVNDPNPFIVRTAHGEVSSSGAKRWGKGHHDLCTPLPTQPASNDFALVVPVLTEHANASHQRVFNAGEPLRTQCSEVKGGHFALVSAFIAKHYGGVVGQDVRTSLGTVTATDHNSLVTAQLVGVGGRAGQIGPRKGTQPVQTVTSKGGTALVVSHLSKLRGAPESHSPGQSASEPLHTVSAQGNHFAEVRAFLVKYYATDQDPKLREPLHTVTTKDRFGIVTVHGDDYVIADIGLRMLSPRELFNAQGFPNSYIIDRGVFTDPFGCEFEQELTKTAQVRMCGNSVCPPLARALVAANVPELARKEVAA